MYLEHHPEVVILLRCVLNHQEQKCAVNSRRWYGASSHAMVRSAKPSRP